MPFHFTLDPLLRLRQSLEHQREISLRQAHQQAAQIRRSLQDLENEIAALAARSAQDLEHGVSAVELQFDGLRRSILVARREQSKQQLAQALSLCSRCLQALQEARRQREAVDTLRSQQLSRYREHEARREQRQLDDVFLLRREFLRRC